MVSNLEARVKWLKSWKKEKRRSRGVGPWLRRHRTLSGRVRWLTLALRHGRSSVGPRKEEASDVTGTLFLESNGGQLVRKLM